jgi:hypothetical protein
MAKIVAIHQPNFFPWLGYFAKIARSDYFIFFDDVQFPKTGGAWSNRVKLLVGGEARWVTAAIDRNYHGTRTIREMSFLADNPWREKSLKSIESNYRRHPYYNETMELISPLLRSPETNIAEYNIQAITAVVHHLGLDTGKLIRSSSLHHEGNSNELLCSITQLVGGDTYMCGGGADGYQDETIFSAAGVALLYQNFQHPIYRQIASKDFVAGLSIIDALMNVGALAVHDVLKNTEGL